jgi:hypothetical protein
MPYSSIVFNEGEPLDPNKLNQLQTNLADIYKTSSSLVNATLNDQGSSSVPIVFSNQRTWTSKLNANQKYTSSPAALPSSFNFNSPIYVTASVAQALPANTQITVSAYVSGNNVYVDVIPNKDITGLVTHFVASQQKVVS